jgi:GLPGLI family protein
MKAQLTLTLLLSLWITSLLAQDFRGMATYKTDRKFDLKMDSTELNSDMQKQLAAQLKKQFQREYTLNFNTDESLYTEVEKLEQPAPASTGGVNIVIAGNTDVLYRNLKKDAYVRETEIMGKEFLIKDKPEKLDWNLEKESKNIGEYTCFKATYTEEVTDRTWDSATDSLVSTTKTRITTAWYTLDIPVQHGPSDFWGLPGLILEINDGEQTILCSKIVLNPEKQVVIEAPKQGKVVTQAEYDEIQEKKMKEMQERFNEGGRRGDDGSVFKIRIGG